MNCPCEQDQCSGSNPNQVLEVVNEKPILFHKVIYPATLGDDTTVNVEDLNYRNVLLVFEANDHAYLYSSDGAPTRIDGEAGDLEEIKAQIAELGGQLSEEETNRIATDQQLQEQITSNSGEIATIKTGLATESDTRQQMDQNLQTNINLEVMAREKDRDNLQININKNADAIASLKTDLTTETTEREQADQNLQNQLTDLNESVDTQLDSFDQSLEALDNGVEQLSNTSVQKDTAVSADASTVTLTKTTGELSSSGTETALPLPVASETSAGVMNASTYAAVQENSENIDSILGGAVVVDDLTPEPSQTELTESWKTATGKDVLINRASIYDTENKLVWYYYENVAEWKSMPAGDAAVSVSIATNDTAGIVKGSNEDGQIAVEADGSMSLNGYDGMQHDIENLSQLVAGIEVPNVPLLTVGSNDNTGISVLTWERTSSGLQPRLTMRAKKTGAFSTVPQGMRVPTATPALDGAMSAADKSKLDSLLEIKSLNDSLELDENGQLSVVGGGSDVNLLTAYTASPAEGDVYSATYVNSRLNSASVILGSSSISTRSYEVSIGNGTGSNPTRFIANVTAGELDTDAVNVAQLNAAVGNINTALETLISGTGAN